MRVHYAIADEDNKEDKNDVGKEQVCISLVSVICMQLLAVLLEKWAKGAFREEGQTQLWDQLIKECNIKDYG